jgi:hypothetical protein
MYQQTPSLHRLEAELNVVFDAPHLMAPDAALRAALAGLPSHFAPKGLRWGW